MSVYTLGSDRWRFRTTGGYSAGKGFGIGVLSVQCGMKSINFEAKHTQGRVSKFFKLNMQVTGVELSAELSFDVIDQFTQISVARVAKEFDYVIPLKNLRNASEPQTFELAGPCALVSFDLGKAHAGKDLGAHKSKTYLFIGMQTTITDRSADWLQKVVDNADSGTLGGNYIKFNKNSGPFSTARMAVPVQLSDQSAGAKAVAASVALYSGQVTVIGTGR